MFSTLPRVLDAVAFERYQHELACATYEQLQDASVDLAVAAWAGDQVSAQLLPHVIAEADDRPEGKTAELARLNWRIESWLHPARPHRKRRWRISEYLPDAALSDPPLDDDLVAACAASVAFLTFTERARTAAAAHHRLILQEA